MTELTELLARTERVARDAGVILLAHFERLERVDYKGIADPVTEADRASEKFIADQLRRITPDIPVYGEEYGFQGVSVKRPAKACWVVDPLDGTANYAVRIPLFAVQIALLLDGRPVVGVVYDPTRDDLFSAARDEGCRRNGKLSHVSAREPLNGISPTGISADIVRARPDFLGQLGKGRSLGSAALQLAYVAAGLYDVAMDSYTKLWDVAPGALLVEEAGGIVTGWDGSELFPIGDESPAFDGKPVSFVASNGRDHEGVIALTSDGLPPKPTIAPSGSG